jgi:hypothetical protein
MGAASRPLRRSEHAAVNGLRVPLRERRFHELTGREQASFRTEPYRTFHSKAEASERKCLHE